MYLKRWKEPHQVLHDDFTTQPLKAGIDLASKSILLQRRFNPKLHRHEVTLVFSTKNFYYTIDC